MQFDDNRLLPQLFGERDQHLDRIERQLGVSVVSRGNRLAIAGPEAATDIAPATGVSTSRMMNCWKIIAWMAPSGSRRRVAG